MLLLHVTLSFVPSYTKDSLGFTSHDTGENSKILKRSCAGNGNRSSRSSTVSSWNNKELLQTSEYRHYLCCHLLLLTADTVIWNYQELCILHNYTLSIWMPEKISNNFRKTMHRGMMYGGCIVHHFNANLYFHVLLLFKNWKFKYWKVPVDQSFLSCFK
jgi:hypothetical protein